MWAFLHRRRARCCSRRRRPTATPPSPSTSRESVRGAAPPVTTRDDCVPWPERRSTAASTPPTPPTPDAPRRESGTGRAAAAAVPAPEERDQGELRPVREAVARVSGGGGVGAAVRGVLGGRDRGARPLAVALPLGGLVSR